ncbi:permease [Kiloniella spongiae]|uniref:Permease n=1 Tax=Kiloniella spongiae TaxID=1489064 RepID=A0A0H2MBW8_9PROT|nr:5-dehydro-2-deoxygluconokinase [Kiloniella spongiae]KLN59848.1 permease [Kiloniella spongiae]
MIPFLEKIKENNFVVLGRAGMDLYPDPPGTKTEDATQFVAALGGSSANIATALVKHGSKASLVTSVSDDAVGRFALNQLDKYGIDHRYVRQVGGEFRNSLALAETRIEDHQSVIYRNGAADFQMTVDCVEKVDYASFAALITTGTVFAAEPSRSAAFHAITLAKQAGLPIIFDVDYRPYSWPSPDIASEVYSKVAALSDIIIGNDEEFDFMAGGENPGLEKAQILAANSKRIVVYKMGEKGAITFTDTEEIHTGIYPVKALKPTGAGDAFMGGFIAALAQGLPIKECILRGSASAAIVVTRVGCAPAMPTPQELDEFLQEHPGPQKPEQIKK